MLKQTERVAVVTFYTTAAAMEWEEACRAENIAGKLFSAPRGISADCGIAWKSPASRLAELETLAREKRLEYEKIWEGEL